MAEYKLKPIALVRSPIRHLKDAPRQGFEGGAETILEIENEFLSALDGLSASDEILIFTWFHLADRSVLKVHPRSDRRNPLTGVFATRSPDRPNPIGLHRVSVISIVGNQMTVAPLEAIDGTPVIDIKPVIDGGQ